MHLKSWPLSQSPALGCEPDCEVYVLCLLAIWPFLASNSSRAVSPSLFSMPSTKPVCNKHLKWTSTVWVLVNNLLDRWKDGRMDGSTLHTRKISGKRKILRHIHWILCVKYSLFPSPNVSLFLIYMYENWGLQDAVTYLTDTIDKI